MLKKKFLFSFACLLVVVLLLSMVSPAYTSNAGKMRVWVEFSPGNAANVEKALNGFGAEYHYRFDNLNSFVVTVPETALDGLRHNPNIVSIEEDAPRYLMGETTPYGIDMVQAPGLWADQPANNPDSPLVCIIDSGLYTAHEDFASVNIIGGYPNDWNTDMCGHGTHVAGTITAQSNDVGVVGVNPGTASLYIVKVFGDDCGWAYSSTLVDAGNRCVEAGADVISMSLGGTKKLKSEERAFDSFYSQGVLSIAAAGNDGNTAVSYPGGYSSVMSVAAIDEDKVVADFSQQNATVEIAAPGVGVLSTVPYIATAELTVDGVTYSGNQIEFAALGEANGALVDGGLCTASGSWGGKVVLCQRGDISFYDKVMAAQNGGAVAAVIYNNEPGNFLGTLGEGFTSTIPAISLSQEDGQYLVKNKLDVLGSVNSTTEVPASGYEAWDGTSMATPHVSGVAALVWSYNPTWTNVQIREALDNSAFDLGDPGRDVAYGYGLVQAADALVILNGGDPPPPPPPAGDLFVSVETDKENYADRETVQITVTVQDSNDAPVEGAAVNVTLTEPGGKLKTFSGVSGADGKATFTYRVFLRKSGSGTFTLTAIANKDGVVSNTDTDTFTAN